MMGLIEAPFGDLVFGIMQNPFLRWGAAGAAALWVGLVGSRRARGRPLYILAPLFLAALIQYADRLFPEAGLGRGRSLDQYLAAVEALRNLASLVGAGAIVAAFLCGLLRLFGGVLLVILLAAAFFAAQMPPQGRGVFSAPVFAQMLALLPAVFIVLLTAYGIGGTLRHLGERRP